MVANLFNEYAKQNNIDIRMEAIVYNIENSTREMDDIWSSIDHLLNKQSTKYDIIFYDVIYSQRYSQHLLDLKKWLSEKHMNLYSGVTAKEVGKVDDKWVGLVGISFYFILFIFFFFFFFFFFYFFFFFFFFLDHKIIYIHIIEIMKFTKNFNII